jgi:hypothetical protein
MSPTITYMHPNLNWLFNLLRIRKSQQALAGVKVAVQPPPGATGDATDAPHIVFTNAEHTHGAGRSGPASHQEEGARTGQPEDAAEGTDHGHGFGDAAEEPGGTQQVGGEWEEVDQTEEPDNAAEEVDQDEEYAEATDEAAHRQQVAAPTLPSELHYLDELIRYRLTLAFQPSSPATEPEMPPYEQWELPLGQFIIDYNRSGEALTADETRLLLIALVHHVQPDLFDHSIHSRLKGAGDFPRIGGARGKNFRGFIPTGETALFLLAGDDWKQRLQVQQFFWADHVFAKKKILWLEDIGQGEPSMSGKIILSQDYVDIFTHSKVASPHFNMNFPARLIATPRSRDQLIISSQLNSQLEDLMDWIRFKDKVERSTDRGKFRKGYRSLFYGPSGTGKTFAACILGKDTGKEVYRIDLSMVVSKYIGETEKNLELIFARAENKKWILFFDEADALFGKRTNIRDAHDKYANQEVSYLLQRIEDYDGLVILATNMRTNIDDAFIRRFNSVLKFSIPNAEERRIIWQNSFPKGTRFLKELPATEAGVPPAENTDNEADPTLPDYTLYPANLFTYPPPPEEPKAGEPHQGRRKGKFYRYVRLPEAQAASTDGGEAVTLDPNELNTIGGQAEGSAPVQTAGSGGSVDFSEQLKKYVLSGANIENVVHYASIKGARRQADARGKSPAGEEQDQAPLTIYLPDLIDGIRRELSKDGIPFG